MANVTRADVVAAYADFTEDRNPIHTDPDFAKRTRYGAPIVFGTLVLNALWAAFEAEGIDVPLEDLDIRFKGAVFVGDALRVDIDATEKTALVFIAGDPKRSDTPVITASWGEPHYNTGTGADV